MKMALIGGGSVRTIYFTQSIAKYAEKLGINHLVIMDNDVEKLNIFGYLAKYMVTKSGSTLKVDLTTNPVEAVKNADYVVTTIRVGQDEARIYDERVALSKGLIGQETTGAGGFAYALRTIPVMKEYLKLIKEHSNNAIVFNFTNPSGLVSQAMYSYGYDNVIGICDNATGVKINLAEALKINASELFVGVYGLNHLSWVNSVKAKDIEILDKLMKNEHFIDGFHDFSYFDKDLIKSLGTIPNGYLYYFYHRERALKNILASEKTRGESIYEINQRMLKLLREVDIEKKPEKAMEIYHALMHEREGSYMSIELGNQRHERHEIDIRQLGLEGIDLIGNGKTLYEGYAGVAFNYIEAMKNNDPIDIAINVPNKGAIPGLRDDDVVEITCMIDKDGAHPVKVKDVPENNMLLIRQIKQYERLTVEAVKNRSRELAVQALMVHPLVNSYSLAKELVDEYLKVHAKYLEGWK